MSLYFAAQIKPFFPGNFGTKDDAVGQTAYRDFNTALQANGLQAVLKQSSDDIVISVDVGWEGRRNRGITLSTGLSNFFDDILGNIPSIRIPISKVTEDAKRWRKELILNIAELSTINSLRHRLTAIQDAYNLSGFEIKHFADNDSLSKKIGPIGQEIAEQWIALFDDPKLTSVMSQYNQYKYGSGYIKSGNNDVIDFDSFIAQRGIPKGWPKEGAAVVKQYNDACKEYERHIPREFSINIGFNVGFEFPKASETLKPEQRLDELEAMRARQTVRFTREELMKTPELVKQKLISAHTYWNSQLEQVV